MGFDMTEEESKKMKTKKRSKFTEEQDQFIKANYLNMNNTAIGAKIGKTRDAVCNRAHRLGVPKIEALSGEITREIKSLHDSGHTPSEIHKIIRKPREQIGRVLMKAKAPTTSRQCLKCSNDFASSHIGNRICNRCKQTDGYRDGFNILGYCEVYS